MNILSMDLNKKQMDYTFSPYSIPCSHSLSHSCEYCSSYFNNNNNNNNIYNLGEDHNNDYYYYMATTENNSFREDEYNPPFKYNYLLNLFSAPNMAAFLAEATVTDDLYALPIHLQRLISEAKEEVVIERTRLNQEGELSTTHPALQRLERVRSYCWLRSGADMANLMSLLMEVANDDDELQHILMD